MSCWAKSTQVSFWAKSTKAIQAAIGVHVVVDVYREQRARGANVDPAVVADAHVAAPAVVVDSVVGVPGVRPFIVVRAPAEAVVQAAADVVVGDSCITRTHNVDASPGRESKPKPVDDVVAHICAGASGHNTPPAPMPDISSRVT